MVHGASQLSQAKLCSQVLFGDGTKETMENLTKESLDAMFSGIRRFEVYRGDICYGVNIVELLAVSTSVFPSKNEARKMITGGGVSINKEKKLSTDEYIGRDNLILDKYMLVQRGKKNYFLIEAV
jgi:tyrosyl-tRNA synthetase